MTTLALPRKLAGTLIDLVRDRRSIRSFASDGVSRELIFALLRDAQWAPSPHNAQPWRFTVLFEQEDKRRLADGMADQLRRELVADGTEPVVIEQQTDRSRKRITSAPVAVLCSLVREGLVPFPNERRNTLEFQMAVQSVGAVLQTLFLLAQTRGLGTCWMAAPMYCPEVVRATLELPAEYEPQALVLIGYPAGPGKVRPRLPADEVIDLR